MSPSPGPAATVVLVVDDNDGTRYALAHSLRRGGYEVWEASSGEEALRLAARNPDLITLDVRLPDILGFEVCRRIKADPATQAIPVLQTSASFTQSADRVQGLQGGADGYLVQPIEPEELLATVHALLRIRRAEAVAAGLAAQWQATFDAISSGVCLLDGEGTVERCNEAFAAMTGLAIPRIVGRPFEEIFRTCGIDDPACLDAVRRRRHESRDIALGVNWYRIAINPLPSGNSAGSPVACVFTDISAARYAERRLERLNEELTKGRGEAALRAATQEGVRLAAAVQDLRNSARSLGDLSARLREGHGFALDPDGKRLVDRIRTAAAEMEALLRSRADS